MNGMNGMKVLISGASIAGPALAYWLTEYGCEVTVVERAPAPRDGGQAVDFRGEAHLTMLRRMGILAEIERLRTGTGTLNIVDANGADLVRLPAGFTGGDVEILRGDLVRLLYERTRDRATYVFGDSIAALAETADGVRVTFERGAPRTYDLVVGADGLHSNVRRLTFGPESRFIHRSGYHVAIFNAPNDLGVRDEGILYNEPGRGLSVSAVGDRTTVNVTCVFAGEGLEYDHRDIAAQKEILAGVFAGTGWHAARLMAAMRTASDFYFDAIGIVRMDHYTKGRVALIGDAGYGATCGGMGAGMAMIASYVLAGELAAAGGDHVTAFARYEEQIRGYAKACQRVAGGAGPFLAPPTETKIRRRNRMYKVLTTPMLTGLLNKLTTHAANHIKLKEYAA